jgi:hypothetical protein
MPQPPQLFGSFVVFSQPVVQHVSDPHAGPPLHPIVDWHLLATQVSPGMHTIPQPPQSFGSFVVLSHPSAQQTRDPVQAGPPLHVVDD